MEVNVVPSYRSVFPIKGILIKSAEMSYWVLEMQRMQISLEEAQVFPLPGESANSIWGCLVVSVQMISKELLGRNERCQFIAPGLFIPEKSKMTPTLTGKQISELFATEYQIFHPEFGWYEVGEPINWKEYLDLPQEENVSPTKPSNTIFVPKEIRLFRMVPLESEQVLKKLEKEITPERKPLPDKKLNQFERARLAIYKTLIGKKRNSNDTEKSGNGKLLSSTAEDDNGIGFIQKLKNWGDKGLERMMEDFSDLEERNKDQLAKFLDMLKDDPMEAMKYALPIDSDGTSRGGGEGAWSLSKLHTSFDWNSSTSIGSGRGGVNLGNEAILKLTAKYRESAKTFEEQGNLDQAVFVYLKLLKDVWGAARVLKDAKRYSEAAALYLKINNKMGAAECFELAKMYDEAIKLYKEQKMHEKVGDLYMLMGDPQAAMKEYEVVAQLHFEQAQFVKAALFYKEKMLNRERFRETLLHGWKVNSDAVNCLGTYFSDIESVDEVQKELEMIRCKYVNASNNRAFLHHLLKLNKKRRDTFPVVRTMTYEIVSEASKSNPAILNTLSSLQSQNTHLLSDVASYLAVGNKWKKDSLK
jgi:tetratricopeptide (TPR) repeat protein